MFLVTAILPAIEPLADTVVLELVDDVIESHEGFVDDVHLPLGFADTALNTSIPKRLKPFHSHCDLLQDADDPSHFP